MCLFIGHGSCKVWPEGPLKLLSRKKNKNKNKASGGVVECLLTMNEAVMIKEKVVSVLIPSPWAWWLEERYNASLLTKYLEINMNSFF